MMVAVKESAENEGKFATKVDIDTVAKLALDLTTEVG